MPINWNDDVVVVKNEGKEYKSLNCWWTNGVLHVCSVAVTRGIALKIEAAPNSSPQLLLYHSHSFRHGIFLSLWFCLTRILRINTQTHGQPFKCVSTNCVTHLYAMKRTYTVSKRSLSIICFSTGGFHAGEANADKRTKNKWNGFSAFGMVWYLVCFEFFILNSPC